jgi:hypothetical protein
VTEIVDAELARQQSPHQLCVDEAAVEQGLPEPAPARQRRRVAVRQLRCHLPRERGAVGVQAARANEHDLVTGGELAAEDRAAAERDHADGAARELDVGRRHEPRERG